MNYGLATVSFLWRCLHKKTARPPRVNTAPRATRVHHSGLIGSGIWVKLLTGGKSAIKNP